MIAHARNREPDVEAESKRADGESLRRLQEHDDVGHSKGTTTGGRNEVAAPLGRHSDDRGTAVDEATVKRNLEPVLVALVAVRDRGTHGKALLGAVAHRFDVYLGPGTVYPVLHELEGESILRPHEEVTRINEYRLDDAAAAREIVAEAAGENNALAAFLREALRQLE